MATNEPEGTPPTPGADDEPRLQPTGLDPDVLDDEPLAETASEATDQDNATAFQSVMAGVSKFDLVLGDEEEDGVIVQRKLRRSSNIFSETPRRRTMSRFVQEARAQSLGRANHTTFLDNDGELSRDDTETTGELREMKGLPIIDGRPVNLSARPRDMRDCGTPRLWDKLKRKDLTAEARLSFDKSATAPCLRPKKLALPIVSTSGEKVLASVDALASKLRTLAAHMTQYDIKDVMCIVVPVNVSHSMMLEQKCYDIFVDYAHLHPDVVANSCTWYHRWTTDGYIRENMALAFMLLQNNTEPDLWSTCVEQYEECTPTQQGGPLMLSLILRRIQDQSEQALDLLKETIKKLKIHKTVGEDVEEIGRLLKTTLKVLKSASDDQRSYVPMDFTKTIFDVFQTSSAPEFNEVFKKMSAEILTKADMEGVVPIWPQPGKILTLGLNTHKRLKATGVWDGMVKKSRAMIANNPAPAPAVHNDNSEPPAAPQANYSQEKTLNCWNCGGNHHLKDCTKPRNEAKIEEARRKFQSFRRNRGKPKYKSGQDGKPMVLNKNGLHVLDQKKWKALKLSLQGGQAAEAGSGIAAPADPQAAAIRNAVARGRGSRS